MAFKRRLIKQKKNLELRGNLLKSQVIKNGKRNGKITKQTNKNLEFDKGNLKFYQEASKKTSEIIDFWKKSSPLLFDKVDKATNEFGNKVDFVLGTENSIEEGYYGATMFEYGKYSKKFCR